MVIGTSLEMVISTVPSPSSFRRSSGSVDLEAAACRGTAEGRVADDKRVALAGFRCLR